MNVVVSEKWKTDHPNSQIGIMILTDLTNPTINNKLDKKRIEIESVLRNQFSTIEIVKNDPVLQHYQNYYKRFKKTYHVMLQLRSVALDNKSIPNVSALVTSMFLTELKNRILTAGHDLDKLSGSIHISSATGEEIFTMMNGKTQTLKSGDMYTADNEGVLSSIIYGPDARTKITKQTKNACFVVYGPEGIDKSALENHLKELRSVISFFSPDLKTELLNIY